VTSYGKPAHELPNCDVIFEAARMLHVAVVPVAYAQDYLDLARELRDRNFGVTSRVKNAPCIPCGAEAQEPCGVKPAKGDRPAVYFYCADRLRVAEGQR
jgi:hypothetical protein